MFSLGTLGRLWGLFVLVLAVFGVSAQNVQPIPPLTAHVIDQTGTLDAIQLKGLEDKLMAFEQSRGTQIAVLVVATTLPEDDASFANRVGNAWKIGRKDVGDGILVVLAKDDRKVRVEVAKALEGAVPDLAAKRIIDEAMIPRFRTGDYSGGLHAGIDQLMARVSGEQLPAPAQRDSRMQQAPGGGFGWIDLAIFMFIGVPIAGAVLRGMFGRPLGSLFTGAGAGTLAFFLTSSAIVAGIAALIALFFTLVSGLGSSMRPRRPGWGGPVVGGPWIGGAGGGPWGGGGGFGGGGWGGSGGGGDFGGGGASGNW